MKVPALPTAREILGALEYPPAPWQGTRPDGALAEVMDQIVALHRNNAAQWDREDDARTDDLDDSLVAAAKRDIDRLNRARHAFIVGIDRAILHVLPRHEGAPLVTETPGMAIDRLSVLVIRAAVTRARAASGTSDARLFADRLPQLHSQLDTLGEAIAVLLDDLANGRRRFVIFESLKLYGPADPEEVG